MKSPLGEMTTAPVPGGHYVERMIRLPAWLLCLPVLAVVGCSPSPMDQAFVPPAAYAGLKSADRPLGPDPINGISWATLSQSDLRAQLPNRATTVMIERQNLDGSISLAGAAVSGAPGAYTVVVDNLKFTTQTMAKGPEGTPAIARIGVGLRIRAQVVTLRPGLNLGSLLAIATAAQAGDLTGTFSVDLLGLDAPNSLLLLSGAEVSLGSVQALLATVQAVEQRLIAQDSSFRPLLVAWRNLRPDEVAATSVTASVTAMPSASGSVAPGRAFQSVPATSSPASATPTAPAAIPAASVASP